MKFLKVIQAVLLLIIPSEIFSQDTTLTRYPYIQKPSVNSVLIAWGTQDSTDSVVEYGSTSSLGSSASDAALVALPIVGSPDSTFYLHGVEITGLAPNTTYYYQVLSGGDTLSAVENFHTNNDTLNPSFDFMIFGDMGDGGPPQMDLRNRILTLDFDLAILTGDIVYNSGEWKNFDPKHFVPYKDIIKQTAFFPSLGNHDFETDDGAPYIANFFLPHNNPDSSEYFYSFNYGRTHFICLDLVTAQEAAHSVKFDPASTQYAWLKSDLEAASAWADFIIPFYHHAPYVSLLIDNYPIIREYIAPLFEEFDVEVAFAGHSHFYERWHPINGVTHIITGGGGGSLEIATPLPGVAYYESVFHVTLASITDKTLSLKMVRTNGSIGDSTTFVSSTLIDAKTVYEAHTAHLISVTAPWLKDRNRNSSITLEFKLSADIVWTSADPMTPGEDLYTGAIPDLTHNTEYDIKVTYIDPDGVVGDSVQTIENILTTPLFTDTRDIFASFSPTSIVVTAEYFGDGNNNATAGLKHKLSAESQWIDDGAMVKDSAHSLFSLTVSSTDAGKMYDFQVTFDDPDSVGVANPVTQTAFSNILQPHRVPIAIDGSFDDWGSMRPTIVDSWILDGSANEYIWRDALDDDLGDGGDAPNADDNPEPYTYPTSDIYSGTEADIEEFRVAYDDNNFYFLIALAGSPGSSPAPYSIILIDKDGADSGRHDVESKTEVELGVHHAWDFKITVNNGVINVFDTSKTDVSSGSLTARNLDMSIIELSVPVATVGSPTDSWSFALLQTLGSVGKVSEILKFGSGGRSGGGSDVLSDPDVFDLIGATGDAQYNDLNNYTDSIYTILNNSWVNVAYTPSAIIVGIDPPGGHAQQVPNEFKLFQNYPNPFNPSTTLLVDLPETAEARLVVYNLLGREVARLVDGRLEAGYHRLIWNGRDFRGREVPTGIYIARLVTPSYTRSIKMVMLK
ncbi:MAG: fibronectin type III domain-containing protein [Candidatus Marinimicrobia bacterium]|nr:fibronectin type III domain-containing protein [Candidatus Neomarinimicrobiota bacterium]